MTTISPSTFQFLKTLARNNNREWFAANRDRYLTSQENMLAFAGELLNLMRKHDHLETGSGREVLYRIYRDTRFSKDKTPYKTYWAGHFKRATKQLRGGYYFQVGPGKTMMAGGFFSPNPADLLRIRQDIDYNYPDWQKLLQSKIIHQSFGPLQGEKVATAPKGFPRDHTAISLLRHKQFYFEKRFSDAEAMAPGFLKELNQAFKNLRTYFNYMSEVLTTDLNGEPL